MCTAPQAELNRVVANEQGMTWAKGELPESWVGTATKSKASLRVWASTRTCHVQELSPALTSTRAVTRAVGAVCGWVVCRAAAVAAVRPPPPQAQRLPALVTRTLARASSVLIIGVVRHMYIKNQN